MKPLSVLPVLLLMLVGVHVCASQDPLPVRMAIEEFLHAQTQGLPGEVSFEFRGLDPANQLAPCGAFDVGMAPGARAWGRTNVTVRCLSQEGWSIFVPVRIRVVADYMVSARPLAMGETIAASDLARRHGDLSDLPGGVVTDERQAIGRTMGISLAAGRPLRSDMLRLPIVVQQNQTVKVVSRGPGFQVSNEGKALTRASEGQVVQVRLGNGQIISGIAREGGVVEVGF